MAAEANAVVNSFNSIQNSVAGLAGTYRKIKGVPEKSKALGIQLANAITQVKEWGPKFTDCPPFTHLTTWVKTTQDEWKSLEPQADKVASGRLCFPFRVAGGAVKGGSGLVQKLDDLRDRLKEQLKAIADHLSRDRLFSQAPVGHHRVPWHFLQLLHIMAVEHIANHLLFQQHPAASIRATASGEGVNTAVACFGQLAELQHNNQQAGALLSLWPKAKQISEYFKDRKVCFLNAANLPHTNVLQEQCKQVLCCLLEQLSGDQSPKANMGDAQTALQNALSQAGRSLIIVQSVSTVQMWACLQELKGSHEEFKLIVTVLGCSVDTDLDISAQVDVITREDLATPVVVPEAMPTSPGSAPRSVLRDSAAINQAAVDMPMSLAEKEVAARQMTTLFDLVRGYLQEHQHQPANLFVQANKQRLQLAFEKAAGAKTKCIARKQDGTLCTNNAKRGMYCGIVSHSLANTDL